MRIHRWISMGAAGGLFCVSPAVATTHYVDVSNAAPVAPYTNWATASTNIQMAIVWSDSGDEILVAPGTYLLAGAPVELPIDKTLTLRSAIRRAAVVDAQGLSQGLVILGTNSVVEGFTVRNGFLGIGYGAGIALGRAAVVRDCLVTDNHSSSGGGIMIGGGATNALVEDCTIAGNVAVNGPGGGLVLYDNSYGRVNRCVISNNVAATYGGGVWIQHGGSVSNCRIVGNQALGEDGGGIHMVCEGTTNPATVVNCVIAGNGAARNGGGLYASGPAGTLSPVANCTIVSNAAGQDGGGAYAHTARFINDILYFNSAPTNANLEPHMEILSCIISNCCTTSNYFWPNITNAPAFVDAGAGDFRLATASFCIDAGTTNGAPRSDIEGNPRPRRGMPGMGSTNCDMGAYEYGFHFNSIEAVSSNAMRFRWDVQDVGHYRLDLATNAAADPAHPAWNVVMGYTQATVIGLGQFAVLETTVTNPVPPMPGRGLFRLRIDRATAGKRRTP